MADNRNAAQQVRINLVLRVRAAGRAQWVGDDLGVRIFAIDLFQPGAGVYNWSVSTLKRSPAFGVKKGSDLRPSSRSLVGRGLRLIGQCGHRGSLAPMTGIAQVADVAGSDHSNNHFRQQRRSASTLSGISIAKNRWDDTPPPSGRKTADERQGDGWRHSVPTVNHEW